ncbi:probable GTP-binding protein OBGM, mitochondrial [Argentina anserina]|uniref:probable GTP-binding protein OBGM, mitochondrial n=1 Tax=Argentina anserina TaxID=57926 RepID=UPI002176626D|nr:probable GTP-binding protein OBGM, mitochondrial [Potentilla anserina]XP_050367348.1 probable GTP-binding protein OBGM, mitochondrial [Potentilla anserina]XP_050367349.1 probable GTP-binding protein OBGM, mitochondrial [Potentilla anserina]
MWVQRAKPLWHIKALRQSAKSPCIFSISSSYSDTPHKKSKLAPLQERKMIDRFRLYAKGGSGGSGCSSSRRSRHDRDGVPDGGNGGKGGDVILECSPTVWDFSGLQPHLIAQRGGHGSSKNKIGTRGADKVAQVPVGTVIHLVKGEIPFVAESHVPKDLDPWELPGTPIDDVTGSYQQSAPSGPNMLVDTANSSSGPKRIGGEAALTKEITQVESTEIPTESPPSLSEMCSEDETKEKEQIQYNVAELTVSGQQFVIARGAKGGLGSVSLRVPKKFFSELPSGGYACSRAQAKYDQQLALSAGSPGSEAVLILELKSIADVSLVGMPNAGKSTLLGAISRAKPAVGHYAFTTLRPNLGNLNFDDFSLTVADVPGLIKGAHENRGLGHAFLRHIERTKVIAYVVDLAAGLDGGKGIPPWEQLRDLVLELEYHQVGLSDRPSLIVANKIDEEGTEGVHEELKRRVHDVPIFPVCAILGEGIQELKIGLRKLVNGEMTDRLQVNKIMVD